MVNRKRVFASSDWLVLSGDPDIRELIDDWFVGRESAVLFFAEELQCLHLVGNLLSSSAWIQS